MKVTDIIEARGGFISLGRRGEHLARAIRIDLLPYITEFGDGSAVLVFQRRSDEAPYPVEAEREDDSLIWTANRTDTAIAGIGRMELQWYVGDVLAKSTVWRTEIAEALEAPAEAPPEVDTAWNEAVFAAKEAAETAAERAKWYYENMGGGSTGGEVTLPPDLAEKLDDLDEAKEAAETAAESASASSASAEQSAESAVTAKEAAETAAETAAQSAQSASTAKTAAERASESASGSAADAETARAAAVTAKEAAEAAAEEARRYAEGAGQGGSTGGEVTLPSDLAEKLDRLDEAKEAAETAAQAAETAQQNAAQSKNSADGFATAAQQSARDASKAKAEAESAQTAAQAAQTAAQAAQTAANKSKTAAEQSAQTAQTYAEQAKSSADSIGTAKTAAEAAQTAANKAKNDAQSASTSASASAESAVTAKEAAETAAQTASQSAQTASTAKTAAERASESASGSAADAETARAAAVTAKEAAEAAAEECSTALAGFSDLAERATNALDKAEESAAMLNALEIGGTNLLRESMVTYAESYRSNGVTYRRETDGWFSVSGTCTNTTATASGRIYGTTSTTDLIPLNGTYTLTAEFDGNPFLTSSTIRIQAYVDGLGSLYINSDTPGLSRTFTVENGSLGRVCVYLQGGANGKTIDGRVRFKLEKGTVPTAWSPSPEDVSESIRRAAETTQTVSGTGYSICGDADGIHVRTLDEDGAVQSEVTLTKDQLTSTVPIATAADIHLTSVDDILTVKNGYIISEAEYVRRGQVSQVRILIANNTGSTIPADTVSTRQVATMKSGLTPMFTNGIIGDYYGNAGMMGYIAPSGNIVIRAVSKAWANGDTLRFTATFIVG